MSADDSFQVLLEQLRCGNQEAAARIFREYAGRLIRLAASRLDAPMRPKVGPEDVVQSVFRSFFRRQQAGEFELGDWNDLWDLLVLITVRKCCNRAEYFQAACRDVRREVRLPGPAGDSGLRCEAVARDPTPAEAAELAETVQRLVHAFKDRDQAIVQFCLQGYPVVEISEQLGCSERKVYRVREEAKQQLGRMQAEH